MGTNHNAQQRRVARVAVTVPAVLACLLASACGPRQHQEHGYVFVDWYIVKPVVATGMTTAYGKITNSRAEAATLEAVSLDCADEVELHETIETAGRVSMVSLKAVSLAPGETLAFTPGKKHLMVMGLRQPVTGICEITFRLSGIRCTFEIPVKERKD